MGNLLSEFGVNAVTASALGHNVQRISEHKLFGKLTSLAAIRVIMEHHVWCVWDFMCLAKALQSSLTSTIPWFPSPYPEALFDINAILATEETDEGPDGERRSHFEEFILAMREAGANTEPTL